MAEPPPLSPSSPVDRRRSASGGLADKRRKSKPLLVELQTASGADDRARGFSISNSGVLEEGDISISKEGMLMPQGRPSGTGATTSASSTASGNAGVAGAVTSGQSSGVSHRSGVESPKDEIHLEDLDVVSEIGRGAGGVVQKVVYRPTGRLMAMKVIRLNVVEQVRKQILVELKTLYQSQSRHIVKFYGAFFSEGHIQICLELMDGGSLESLVAKVGPFPEVVVGRIAGQVLRGLVYLHKDRHLLHRDLKPSNILVNSRGEVKISDFGVSGQLASSLASRGTWVGTVTYFSPERIQGKTYSVASDIWSFGVSMLELAMGHYPFYQKKTDAASALEGSGPSSDLGFFDLLFMVVDHETPKLDPASSSEEIRSFMAAWYVLTMGTHVEGSQREQLFALNWGLN